MHRYDILGIYHNLVLAQGQDNHRNKQGTTDKGPAVQLNDYVCAVPT